MSEVIYLSDRRYPGPDSHAASRDIQGLPTQAELDSYPRMFTWGELKDIIVSGQLEGLMRNKQMQAKYNEWIKGIKLEYGSTENYLKRGRLPFPDTSSPPINGQSKSREHVQTQHEYLTYDSEKGLDTEKYAVLPNDWPYNIPYGVRHFCVWSKLPIGHPSLVDNDSKAWAKIEEEGLGGFTGIIPVSAPERPVLDPSCISSLPQTNGKPIIPPDWGSMTLDSFGQDNWLSVDLMYGGKENKKWAGVEYTAKGGEEVDKMVKALWDQRGWECLWFVNPPRLQSVPGLSHFHVLARRKTPEEIDASELFWGSDK
ncbi:uncharacterized protein IL334_001401 [Kwoniella shivajii]|uniref:Uncharacterized protein n=1 Tax=Kwoniella shivajii TaxID=564305 RepID=A0ABZ1CSY4_9TREE|nr:hypothetical protein IL334_001401 [Kwoniella shivajii]